MWDLLWTGVRLSASPPIDSYSGSIQPLTVAPANIRVRGFCFGLIWLYKFITAIIHQFQDNLTINQVRFGELGECELWL